MTEPSAKLMDSVKRLLITLTSIVSTRLELLVNEVQEERLRLAQMLLSALFGLFCFGLGILLLTVFIVILFWDTQRLLVVGLLCLLFFGLAGWIGMSLRNQARTRPKLFSASLAEFARDREFLGGSNE